MLARFRRRNIDPPPDPTSVNFSKEHISLAKSVARQHRLFNAFWRNVPRIQNALIVLGSLWLLALPYEGLWKRTYVDEHALQPAQVNVHFDWGNVHKADVYLGELEKMGSAPFEVRTQWYQKVFSEAGLNTGNTSSATYAHVTPPRSAGTETIIVSANWISRDGGPNMRGVATLLALGDFLRGQNYWAFDLVLVIGEGYQDGLALFMEEYRSLFYGVVWTGLNLDYPGHSFSHLGLFYEGTNGRLPNQDVINVVSKVAQNTGGIPIRYHNIPDEPGMYSLPWLGTYIVGAKHLLHHLGYVALGRGSGGHGPLARHRIDSLTLYCTPATGPHGFHSIGRTIEGTLRSYNNLLERLHASYFFYLLPRPHHFIPVGHYLPAAILLGASLTIGGFDCPAPLGGLSLLCLAFVIPLVFWVSGLPTVFAFLPLHYLPRASGDTRKALISTTRLLYGALVSTLAMINFPQSVVLSFIVLIYLFFPPLAVMKVEISTYVMYPAIYTLALRSWTGIDLILEWKEVGNMVWPGVFLVWMPLWFVRKMVVSGGNDM